MFLSTPAPAPRTSVAAVSAIFVGALVWTVESYSGGRHSAEMVSYSVEAFALTRLTVVLAARSDDPVYKVFSMLALVATALGVCLFLPLWGFLGTTRPTPPALAWIIATMALLTEAAILARDRRG